jgi:hypothetical protein
VKTGIYARVRSKSDLRHPTGSSMLLMRAFRNVLAFIRGGNFVFTFASPMRSIQWCFREQRRDALKEPDSLTRVETRSFRKKLNGERFYGIGDACDDGHPAALSWVANGYVDEGARTRETSGLYEQPAAIDAGSADVR